MKPQENHNNAKAEPKAMPENEENSSSAPEQQVDSTAFMTEKKVTDHTEKQKLLNEVWNDVAYQIHCHKKQCHQLTKEMGYKLLNAMDKQGINLSSDYAKFIFREATFLIKEHMKAQHKMTIPEALAEVVTYLETVIASYLNELVSSNQHKKLLSLLEEETLKAIRLYEVKRFRDQTGPQQYQQNKSANQESGSALQNQNPGARHQGKFAISNSGLFVDAL